MAKKFNLAELMGETVSKSNTGEMRVEQISLAEIEENENNSYAQNDIDELAGTYSSPDTAAGTHWRCWIAKPRPASCSTPTLTRLCKR